MLLSITARGSNPADLGYLLHKHPDRFQSYPIRYGKCHVFYPELTDSSVTVCLLTDIDSITMAKANKGFQGHALAGYVNDRPYVVSSLMSGAIASAFGSAMNATCNQRPELVGQDWEFEVGIDVVPVHGGEQFLRKMFEPLGYQVQAERIPLDSQFPDWGHSHYFAVTLKGTLSLDRLLSHLYVLFPVFDHQKHYFSDRSELEKLLAKGEAWLADHPEKEIIVRRYLKFQSGLRRLALKELRDHDDAAEGSESTPSNQSEEAEASLEKTISLNQVRMQAVESKLLECGAQRVIDLGCGEGKLIRRLVKQWQIQEIVGVDVTVRALEIASSRLKLDSLPAFQASRIKLIHGSLMYRDRRFENFDAAAIVEVIEHLDVPRLAAFERVVFRHARPKNVIVTTPNAEYNVMWESLPAGKFRHADHRFEWTREEFQGWCQSISERFGYTFECFPIGPLDESVGSPTQMAVFRLPEVEVPQVDGTTSAAERVGIANESQNESAEAGQ